MSASLARGQSGEEEKRDMFCRPGQDRRPTKSFSRTAAFQIECLVSFLRLCKDRTGVIGRMRDMRRRRDMSATQERPRAAEAVKDIT